MGTEASGAAPYAQGASTDAAVGQEACAGVSRYCCTYLNLSLPSWPSRSNEKTPLLGDVQDSVSLHWGFGRGAGGGRAQGMEKARWWRRQPVVDAHFQSIGGRDSTFVNCGSKFRENFF